MESNEISNDLKESIQEFNNEKEELLQELIDSFKNLNEIVNKKFNNNLIKLGEKYSS